MVRASRNLFVLLLFFAFGGVAQAGEESSLFRYYRARTFSVATPTMQDSGGGGEAPVPSLQPEATSRGRNWVGARAGIYQLQLTGRVTIPAETFASTRKAKTELSLENTLGILDEELAPYGEIFVTTRFLDVSLSGWTASWKGDSILKKDFAFDADDAIRIIQSEFDSDARPESGENFVIKANTPISTEIDIETVAAKVVFKPLPFEYFELGIMVGARLFHINGRVEIDTTTIRVDGVEDSGGNEIDEVTLQTPFVQEEDANIPLGTIGLQGRVFITKWLEIGGSVGYFEYSADTQETEARVIEAEADVTVNLGVENVSVSAMYYYLDLFGEHEGLTAEFQTHGPGLAVRIRF